MGQRVALYGEINFSKEVEAKASLNRAYSRMVQTRNRAIYP